MSSSVEVLTCEEWLFARDVMDFFMAEFNIAVFSRSSHESNANNYVPSPFRPVTGQAMQGIYSYNLGPWIIIFHAMFRNRMFNDEEFYRLMRNLSIKGFKRGYDPIAYLKFCTFVSTLAAALFREGNFTEHPHYHTPGAAVHIMRSVIAHFKNTGDFPETGWIDLYNIADEVCSYFAFIFLLLFLNV